MNEEWRPIVEFDGDYEISNLGRVRSLKRRNIKIVSQIANCYGYLRVQLRKNMKVHFRKPHILVLEAFVSPRPNGLIACHKNGNKKNCQLENLYWGTPKENSADMIRHGTSCAEERNAAHKLKNYQVVELRELYDKGEHTFQSIADIYGMSDVHIGRIIKRKARKTI